MSGDDKPVSTVQLEAELKKAEMRVVQLEAELKVGKWKADLVEDLKSWAPLLPDVLFRDTVILNHATEYFLIECKSIKYSYDMGRISKNAYASLILRAIVGQYNKHPSNSIIVQKLGEAADAIRELTERRAQGKVVVVMD